MARVGPFELLECVGRGTTGEVHRARHTVSGEVVAVKVLAPEHRARWASLVRREVEAVARLDHPAVVWIHDCGTDPDHGPWLALELASGGTLADSLPVRNWTALRTLLGELLGALGHAHARGVLHRDLKPANVLLCTLDDGRPGPKLADFSMSRLWDAAAPGGGTPEYWAPEQRDGRARAEGPWTDLYALGALAWAATTGGPPATASWRPAFSVPPGFSAWVERLLAPEPEDRFASAPRARAALDLLTGVVEDGPVTAAPTRETFDEDLDSVPRPHPRRSMASLGLLGLRPVPMVGRDAELAVVRRARATAGAGGGPVVVRVTGEPGAGRTHFLEAVAVGARERGDAVVCTSFAATGGFGPRPSGDTTAVDFARWAAGIAAPVLLVLDDADDADLTDLARARAPHLVVVAAPGGRAPLPGTLEISLGPLPDPARLARALGVVDGSTAFRIGEWSGGSPSRVVGLVRQWLREGVLAPGPDGWVTARPLPQPTSEAPLADDDRPMLEVLALCGAVATTEVWASACAAAGVPWSPTRAEELRRSGSLAADGPPRLADGALVTALLRDGERRGTLRAVAAAVGGVLARDVPKDALRDEQVARCWELAGWWAEAAAAWFAASVAPRWIHDAERRHGLLDGAERALLHAPDEDLRAKVRVWRAATRGFDGDVAGALAELRGHAPPADPYTRWRQRTLEAELEHAAGRWYTAVVSLRDALALAPKARDREVTSEHLEALLFEVEDADGALALLREREPREPSVTGARIAMAAGDLDAAAGYLLGPPRTSVAPMWVIACLELALRRGEPVVDEAEHAFASLSGRHRRYRAVAAALWCLAAATQRPGALPDAEAAAREAVAIAGVRWRWPRDLLADAAALAPAPLAARLGGLADALGPLEGPPGRQLQSLRSYSRKNSQ